MGADSFSVVGGLFSAVIVWHALVWAVGLLRRTVR